MSRRQSMAKNTAILAVCLVSLAPAASADSSTDELWIRFQHKYIKTYTEKEKPIRRLIFDNNVDFISEHNAQADLGGWTFWLALNQFADMTASEYDFLLGFTPPTPPLPEPIYVFNASKSAVLPESIDYRDQGIIGDVRHQGACGTGWAFAATAALEAQRALQEGVHERLSPQHLIDCSRGPGTWMACRDKGNTEKAFVYLKDVEIATEAEYPYENRTMDEPDDRVTCRLRASASATGNPGKKGIKGYIKPHFFKEDALQQALMRFGPMAAAVDASDRTFQFYSHGVYDRWSCGQVLSQAVLIVGYDTDASGHEYYILQNSWGQEWGEGGYIRMARNKLSQCGIAAATSVPIL